jgi:hypothetical protein
MAATCLDLIRSSLRMIGQLGPGRGASASELTDALFVLNSMLDNWNTDSLKIFTTRIDAYNLQAGKYSYTIGPSGADFTAPRPVRIEEANIILNTINPVLRMPLTLIDDQRWSLVKIQAILPGAIPTLLYNDGGNPTSTLYLWTPPGQSYQLELFTWQQLTQFAATTDTVAAPVGYLDAMRYNLAVRLASEWGKPIRPDVVELARTTLADIQSLNSSTPTMNCDAAVLKSPGGGVFNWLTGSCE